MDGTTTVSLNVCPEDEDSLDSCLDDKTTTGPWDPRDNRDHRLLCVRIVARIVLLLYFAGTVLALLGIWGAITIQGSEQTFVQTFPGFMFCLLLALLLAIPCIVSLSGWIYPVARRFFPWCAPRLLSEVEVYTGRAVTSCYRVCPSGCC